MKKLKKNKKNTPIEDLCAKIPKEFAKYLNYCRSLNFEDKPCISDLRRLFKNLMKKKNLDYDYKFDWIKKKTKLPQEIGNEESEEDEDGNYHTRLKALLNI